MQWHCVYYTHNAEFMPNVSKHHNSPPRYSSWCLFYPFKHCHSHKLHYVSIISSMYKKNSISPSVMCSWRRMPCAGISSGSPWPLKTCWRSSRLSAQASAASRQSTCSHRSWRGSTQRGRTSMTRCTSTSLSEPSWGESETEHPSPAASPLTIQLV